MAASVAASQQAAATATTNGRNHNEPETQTSSSKLAGNRTDNSRALADISNGNGNGNEDVIVVYDVEHLATFSTASQETTNNGSKQVNNNDSKSKPHNAAPTATSSDDDDHDGDDDDPVPTRTETGYGSSLSLGCANALANRSSQFDGCGITTPRVALRRLFELEKLSGIWTQRMQIELRQEFMLIVDCETNSVVEKFDKHSVTKPEAFNECNHIYNNIVVFIISQPSSRGGNDRRDDDPKVEGELHIFQCVSQQAQQLVQDILDWKSSRLQPQVVRGDKSRSSGANHQWSPRTSSNEMAKLTLINSPANSSKCYQVKAKEESSPKLDRIVATNGKQQQQANDASPRVLAGTRPMVTVASSSSANENVPVVNVNVRETVQVFNQIAALREKSKPASPTNANSAGGSQLQRPLSDASTSSNSSSSAGSEAQNKLLANGQEQLASLEGASFFKQRSIRAKLTGQDQQQKQGQLAADSTTDTCSAAPTLADQTKPPDSPGKQLDDPSAGRQKTKMANTNNASGTSASSNASGSTNRSSSGSHHQHYHSSKHLHHHHQEPSQPSNGHRRASDHAQAASSAGQKAKSASSSQANRSAAGQRSAHLDQVTTNESYVSVLNHCFDDIEKFILKLQQAMSAARELQQAKRKLSKRSSSSDQLQLQLQLQVQDATGGQLQLSASEMAMLRARARGPNEEDYFEILSKFKLAFNLLAKLKGCIHEPNAPELVHFLFTPLAIIIESARNAKPAVDPTLVGIPYLNQDALDLLSNCCTSKEYDIWMSLGPNWIQPIDSNLLKASRMPSSFQPIFSDGWAPIIGELELIGLVVAPPVSRSPFDFSQDQPDETEAHRHQSDRQHRHRHKHDHQVRPRHPSAGPTGYAPAMPVAADSSPPSDQKPGRGRPRNGHPPVSRHLSEPGAAAYGHAVGAHHDYADPTMEAALSGATSPYRSSRDIYHRPLNASHPSAPHLQQQQQHHHHQRPSGGSSNRSGSVERRPIGGAVRISSSSGGANWTGGNPKSGRAADLHPAPHYFQSARSGGRDYDDLLDPHQLHYPAAPDRYAPTKDHLVAPLKPYQTQSGKQRHLYGGSGQAIYPVPASDEESADYFAHADPDELHLADRQHQHETMLLDLGPAQLDWFYELQSRGALIVRVLFSRAANNDKELSVRRGEILEILDDSRKWWRARNIDLQVAHVPHTIVAPMQVYQTLDDLLANNPTDPTGGGAGCEDPAFLAAASVHYARHPASHANHHRHHLQGQAATPDDWHTRGRNSKNAGAFRYF